MNFRLRFIFFLLVIPMFSFAQSTMYFESSDKTYRTYIPSDWEPKKILTPNTVFLFTPPGNKKEGFMPTTIELELGTSNDGYQNTGIKEIAAQEAGITKNQIGDKISIFSDTLININNKLWWQFAYVTKASKKLKLDSYIFKTIHNRVTYTFTFKVPDEYFDKYINTALTIIYSFMFYTQDKTTYSNKESTEPRMLPQALKPYEGLYKQQHGNVELTIDISSAGEATYIAKEVREFLIEGRKKRFAADLIVEAVDADKITLSTDAVSTADTSIRWAKSVYELHKTPTGLTGIAFSKNKAFGQYSVELAMQNQSTPKLANTSIAVKNNANKPAGDKAPETKLPVNGYGTIDAETGEVNEPAYIKQFGGGQVNRKSPGDLAIAVSGGKIISLKNKGTDEDEAQIRYKFLGFIADLNSYIVYRRGYEADGYVLVNRINGSMANIPGLEYFLSPDKKWMAVYNNDIISSLETSYVTIFAVSENGLKESFYKITFDAQTSKGWGVASLSWLDNNTVVLEKVTANPATEEMKPAGKSWLSFQGGKWILLNSLPKKI